ncbi:MAG: TAT-variant-translocated molybdopterin oxidoreductase [Holophagales bacterium]|nr:TAT-variant-translocated molybdopterin oxidoreductase [Holophagales bacterium]
MKQFDSTTHTLRAPEGQVQEDAARGSNTSATPEGASAADGLTLDAASAHLAESRGPNYWRSLEELAEAPSFTEMLHREFPRQSAEWGNLDRRRFLQLSGASLGLAGLTACTKQPPEKVIPYVRQPEDIVPGRPLFFATAVPRRGYGAPVLAESHMGRPTKLEGNPEHPSSRGATDAITQAEVLGLYDPDRSQAIQHLGQIRTWQAFLAQVDGVRAALAPVEGEGLAVVTGGTSSPTENRLLDELTAQMPKARRFVFEPAAGRAAEGVAMATGSPGEVLYDFSQADVVLAVDSDFLVEGPSAVRYSKDFSQRRKAHTAEDAASMSRLYSVDSAPSSTSTVADHRLALAPSALGGFLVALAAELGVPGAGGSASGLDERATAWVEELAADLRAHAGASALVVGDYAAPELHALALAINAHLGNIGTTVTVHDPITADGENLYDLLAAVDAGEISTLLLLGVNPVYGAHGDQDVRERLDKVKLRIHCGAYFDETGEWCHWHVPESHALESWGDLRSPDGTATIVQPLIQRLYDSWTHIDLLAALVYGSLGTKPADELVRDTWRRQPGLQQAAGVAAGSFDKAWRKWLHDGHVPGTESPPRGADGVDASAAMAALSSSGGGGLELLFRPDPTVFDGRYANNGWLQECPKPITKLTWDNALLMSPRTAEAHGLGPRIHAGEQRPRSPMVSLQVGERSLEVPVWAVPGMADDTLLLHLGYGRTKAGNVGTGTGFDANVLRAADTGAWHATGVTVAKVAGSYLLACTQDHHSMEGRDLIRGTNVPTYEAHPDNPLDIHHHFDVTKTLMSGADFPYNGHRWGMSIDLTACTGCNACLVACVSENNIPVVGKDEVRRGREMHWIRLDRYFVGDDPNEVETVVNQPVPCMQCEQAPCEVVCPVAATVHSDEGLNDMVYNRCVGTRYCSNNCPYKVRRFNFLLYQDFETPQLKLGRNPDVTVRSRGVMEKCTYCVQRINQARIDARARHETMPTDSVQTACQQACPSEAIVFGDLADSASAVTAAKESALDYGLLEELGTFPRTTYLGRVTNPNPRLWARLYPDRPLVKERKHHGGYGGGHGSGHGASGHGGSGAEGGAAEAGH